MDPGFIGAAILLIAAIAVISAIRIFREYERGVVFLRFPFWISRLSIYHTGPIDGTHLGIRKFSSLLGFFRQSLNR